MRHRIAIALAILACSIAQAGPTAYKPEAERGACFAGRPAKPAPSPLWGELRPVGIIHDGTIYDGNQPNCRADRNDPYLHFVDVDTAGGHIFAAFWNGFQIFDARTSPTSPAYVGQVDNNFAVSLDCGEIDQFAAAIDVAEGETGVVALGGGPPLGLTLWDTASMASPRQLYQDPFPSILDLHVARLGARLYAFAGSTSGLISYDATAAAAFSAPCVRSGQDSDSCGVRLATTGAPVVYVDGFAAGGRYYVAASSGEFPGGLRLLDVTNPAVPVVKIAASATKSFGVATWTQGGRALLAARVREGGDQVRIYDLTPCLPGGCAALPAAIGSISVAPVFAGDGWKPVVFSRSDTTPFLYVGNLASCSNQGPGAERLLDVSSPESPRDITPTSTYTDVDPLPGSTLSTTVNYWTWYSNDTNRGFSVLTPMGGKFIGKYFYRTARSLFDVHQWVPGGQSVPLPPEPPPPPVVTPPTPAPPVQPPPTGPVTPPGSPCHWSDPTCNPQPPPAPPDPPVEPPVTPTCPPEKVCEPCLPEPCPPAPPPPACLASARKEAGLAQGWGRKFNAKQTTRAKVALACLREATEP